jgi:hypothetical protein
VFKLLGSIYSGFVFKCLISNIYRLMYFISEVKTREIMQEVIDLYLIPKFKELGLNASGDWLRAIEARASGTTGEIWGLDYTRYLVNGRAAGTPPPIAPLVRWVGFKLGYSGQQAISTAIAISKKIAAEGTEIKKNGGTDLLEILQSPEVQQYVNGRVGEEVNEQIRLRIIRTTKQILS